MGNQRQGNAENSTLAEGEVLPLADTTSEALNTQNGQEGADPTRESKPRGPRQPKQRGPPEDGIPSKNKVMVANLPYDLSEEKVSTIDSVSIGYAS